MQLKIIFNYIIYIAIMMHLMNSEQQKLHAVGYKATPQRLAILAYINQCEGYFTAGELYQDLRKLCPGIGMVTIYRTLKLLFQVGMVCELQSGQNEHCYTRYKGTHHHHLVCQACARVVDVGNCDLSSLENDLAQKTGFDIREHRLEFYGLCRHCQEMSEKVLERR